MLGNVCFSFSLFFLETPENTAWLKIESISIPWGFRREEINLQVGKRERSDDIKPGFVKLHPRKLKPIGTSTTTIQQTFKFDHFKINFLF